MLKTVIFSWNKKALNPSLELSENIGKILLSKSKISFFNFKTKLDKTLGVSKILKQIKFESTYKELETKSCFKRESWQNYLRQILVLMSISALREKFSFISEEFFASIGKMVILGGRPRTRL